MSLPSTFQGAEVPEPKAQLAIAQRSLSDLKPNEVGIKITATAINPVDYKIRDYAVFIQKYPAVLGSDAAGVVAAVGSEVKDLQIGERVFFQGIIGNYESSTFQQYCKMPAELLSKTPDNISDEEAAGIMLTTVAVTTAFYAKSGHGMTPPWQEGGRNVGKGKSMIIIGGASSVGQYAIQLARLSGFERIVTNASSSNHEFLKKIGAHVVLDRSESTPDALFEAAGGLPFDFIFDAISGPSTQKLAIQVLQKAKVSGSHVVVVQSPDPEAKELGQSGEPRIEIKPVMGLGSSPDLRHLSEPLAKSLGGPDGYIAKGLFTPNRPHVVSGGLAGLEEAFSLSKSGVSGKKLVIRPHETK
ncbi:hypothetical protein GGP41_000910 [Bipolaris sorokiniana]|uniref:Enoyl reductase (ER) domain-containing protein n=2 Tax=Cochliobolus sativus TaxID=45130 RepID=A0A8H5ZKA1_COCSA|nr:uncharacterized protein COCSADRAFT_40232 [Bipolaris sorokiniana ND90Pr]EMD60598.1 hypothetical protein COCSADRAFT_40232 [Bipolaris sorokiniana ND90Pr]KAF5852158.1 hypothetical protein GGP41_000910 [Bipolaris sorokiniana]